MTAREPWQYARALECSINAAFKEIGPTGPYVYEDAYYQIKGFKNGNMHIFFKRADLYREGK